MRRAIIAHPFLFAVYPILFLYAYNVDFAQLRDTVLPMAVAIASAVVLFLLLSIVLKDKEKAGLLTSLLVLLVFSYGHVADATDGFRLALGAFVIDSDAVLFPLCGILFALATYYLVRTHENMRTATNILNVVAVALVALSLFTVLSYELRRSAYSGGTSAGQIEDNPEALAEVDTLPDIYYIILDAYAGPTTLDEIWDYDNHEFTDFLTQNGFYVAADSRSNYVMTFLSLSSSLNMEYINYLSDLLGAESKNRELPYEMIQDNEVVRFLKSRGYKFIHFQSGWGPTGRNDHADWDVQCGRFNEFTMVLLQTTMLRPLTRDLVSSDRRQVVLCTFSTLPEVQHRIEAPRFVFAHILVPHPPFLFGPNGEPLDTEPQFVRGPEAWQRHYLGQLEFVNKQVETMVETILSEAELPPIIILQADHGSKSVNWHESRRMVYRERTGILNAYHLPHNAEGPLYDSITPVNTFRLVFNLYLNTSHDLLEDRTYYSTANNPYKFNDITDKVTGH